MTDTTNALQEMQNPFRKALLKGRPLTGIWSMLNSDNAVEALSWSGFDWLLIDGEHSPATLADTMSHLRILAASPTTPIVRLVDGNPSRLKRYLDAGAQTFMLPQIDTAEMAQAAVTAMHYPPRGTRGVAAMHRASRFTQINNYIPNASDSLFLIVQVETEAAIENVEAIAAIDGVDAVFFGPGDLAASMGKLGQPADPEVTARIGDAFVKVRRFGKACGVLAANADLAEKYIADGFDFVSVANDANLMVTAANSVAARFGRQARDMQTGQDG